MSGICGAPGCDNKFVKGSEIRFYRFPLSKPQLSRKWVRSLGLKNFIPTTKSCLCSVHFRTDHFRECDGKQLLRQHAVPTLFPQGQDSSKRELRKRVAPPKETNVVDQVGTQAARDRVREAADPRRERRGGSGSKRLLPPSGQETLFCPEVGLTGKKKRRGRMRTTEQPLSLSLDTSHEEAEQQAEEERAEKEVIRRRPPPDAPKTMDQKANGINPQLNSVNVKISSNTTCQRIYDKRNYCLYCEKPYAKITRHLRQTHSDKVEVAEALACTKGAAMQNLLLSKVRNIGNYQHNCSVLSSGEGQIVPKRQATVPSTSATDYLPCKFCFAMYLKVDLWRHHKRCKLQVKEEGAARRAAQASSSLMLPMDMTMSSGLKTTLDSMTDDTVTQVVKCDPLIISLGERMFLKHGEAGRQRADTRNKMRALARLVIVARQLDHDIVFLKDLINPGKFNTVLDAVKNMTGFDNSTNRFLVASTALKLRQSLVKVSYILQGEALRQEDDVLKGSAEQFLKLIEPEWTTHVSPDAPKASHQQKCNSPQMLPLFEDIKKLQDHLKCLEGVSKKALIDDPSQRSWSELSQVTLTQLILFNRRLSRDVSRMEIATYLQRNKRTMQDELLEGLSPFEKKVCQKLIGVEVRGKGGRKVPVLFPTHVRESVELLIQTRDEVGISPSNPYVFARPCDGSQENIHGCDGLKRFAEGCGAKHPENITSTKLRKHVATVSQLLNLQTSELDQLATSMGHNIEFHREFYRLPDETLRIAKVSRLLLALPDGMDQFKDKSPNISSEEEFSSSDTEDVQSEQTTKRQEGNSEDGCSGERAGTSKKSLPSSRKKKSRRPWSKTEREIVEHHFKDFLKEMKIPGKVDCQRCLNKNQTLRDNGRDWLVVKYFVHNKIISIRKNLCQQN